METEDAAFFITAKMIPCDLCHQRMNAIYCRSVRDTCHDCGGFARRDSTSRLDKKTKE